ncbi:MAG: class I SAM-dependent methyltransferase [Nitrospiria bacterium]
MNRAEHASEAPSPFLVAQLSRLPKGRVLDIASGYGRNGIYLASQDGFEVEAYDRDEAAVSFSNQKAERLNLSFSARCINLEHAFPAEHRYAVVTCFYYLDRNIIQQIKSVLEIGGVIVYETFLIDQHEQFGKPARSSFCWRHNELLESFLDFRVLYYHEGMMVPQDKEPQTNRGRWVAQLLAERIA